MKSKNKVIFENSFSKASFQFKLYNNQLFLVKKLNKVSKREYKSIIKNNFFSENLNLKNLFIINKKINSLKIFLKKKSYEMSYINGNSGTFILKNLDIAQAKILKDFFLDFTGYSIRSLSWKEFDKKIYLRKIYQIEKNLKIKKLRKLLFICKKNLFLHINKIKFYPKSLCHGDLTLSNIIIQDKKIYLIDFLETFDDSILKDLAKIYQEFILGWSSRKLNKNEILRAKTIYNTILDENFFSGFSKKILKLLKFEILMTLIRIFPYVDKKDIITINWLEYSVNKVLKNYNNLDFS